MTTLSYILVWIAVLVVLPFIIFNRLCETTEQRVRRLKSRGWTQRRIAERLNITVYQVRKNLATA